MNVFGRWALFLLFSTSAWAETPRSTAPGKQAAEPRTASRKVTHAGGGVGARPPPCQGPAHYRKHPTQGTLLWGAERQVKNDERSSVLASIDLDHVQLSGELLKDVALQNGRLIAPSSGVRGLAGALLKGKSTEEQPVEVALCDARPATEDPAMEWYRIELWSDERKAWENPCIATNRVPEPRVVALRGVWDKSGTWQDAPGQVTLACENGVIAKCIQWGYKPWEQADGRPLREVHQACTRMARADYCGNGKSHTRDDTTIDIYDALRISTRSTQRSEVWDPERASFEAVWVPEGAACLGQTRDGRPMEMLNEECPGRFEPGAKDLGQGDVCKVVRRGADPTTALLRNHSYGKR